MDTLFDKIFSPKHSETSLVKKLTSPHIFLKDSSILFQNLPMAYQQQLIEDSLFSSDFDFSETSKACKTNLQGLFRTFNHTMSPHIPKVSPCSNLIQEYHKLFENSIDTVSDSISDLNIMLDKRPQKTMDDQYNIFEEPKNSSAPKSSFSVSIADASSPNKKAHFNVTISKAVPLDAPKRIAKEDCNLDQQMANRKTKELQKRSKKRRRRQKKSNSLPSTSSKDVQNHKLQINCEPKRKSLPADEEKNCDILCDVTVSHNSKSVQIVLPNLSSFVVTIESGDDDSDWDTNSEADWLADDSEFQVSGLFVASFSATNACSLLSYESDNKMQEQSLSLMEAKLKEVNKIWNEQTDCLKHKMKSSTVVSFASEEELEEICPIEMYERKGEWEVFAVERLRFKKRINEMEEILTPCLLPEHRAKIYSTLCESIL